MATATGGDAEKTLHETTCSYKRGVLNHNGQAVLTNRRLVFRPTRLEQLAGAREWSIELATITRIQRRKPDNALELFCGANVQRLNGDGTKTLETALRKAMESLDATPADPVALVPGESVVMQGAALLFRDDFLSRKGEITLTTQRLCFSPGGLDKFTSGNGAFEVALDALANCHMEGDRLVVASADTTWRMGADWVNRLFSLLTGLPRGDVLELDGFRTYPAVLADTKSPPPGLLQITRQRLRFGERKVGGVQAEVALHDITRCQVSAIKGERLDIRKGSAGLSLAIPDADDRFAEIFRLMAECAAPGDPETDADGFLSPDGVEKVITPWANELSGKTNASILLAGPAAMLRWPETARRGWLLLTKGDLHFVPAGGPSSGEKVLTLNHGDFHFQNPLAGQPPMLVLSLADEGVQIVPRGGDAFVKHFRQQQELLEKPVVSATPGLRANRRGTYRATPPHRMSVKVGAVFDGVVVRASAFIEGRLLDISADGCRVVTEKPVEGTTTVQLEIPHKPSPVKLSAVVMNSRPPSPEQPSWRLGLRFSGQSPQQDKIIRDLWMGFQRAEGSARQRVEEDRLR